MSAENGLKVIRFIGSSFQQFWQTVASADTGFGFFWISFLLGPIVLSVIISFVSKFVGVDDND